MSTVRDEGAVRLAEVLTATAEPITTAKTPAREDPAGGRWRGSPPGMLQVYARRPCIRRMPAAGCGVSRTLPLSRFRGRGTN
jgi:hypothetical protein